MVIADLAGSSVLQPGTLLQSRPQSYGREVFFVARVSSQVATLLVFVRMSVAPLPVIRLLFFVRLGKFVGTSMVFREVLPPGAIFVVIPVVIVLVTLIVNSNLNASLLRYGDGHHCHWCGKDSSQE